MLSAVSNISHAQPGVIAREGEHGLYIGNATALFLRISVV